MVHSASSASTVYAVSSVLRPAFVSVLFCGQFLDCWQMGHRAQSAVLSCDKLSQSHSALSVRPAWWRLDNKPVRLVSGQSRRANYYWLLRLCGQTDRPQTQTGHVTYYSQTSVPSWFRETGVVNAWNSLPDHVVLSETVNTFKSRLDKFWQHQDMIYDFQAELHTTGSHSLHSN